MEQTKQLHGTPEYPPHNNSSDDGDGLSRRTYMHGVSPVIIEQKIGEKISASRMMKERVTLQQAPSRTPGDEIALENCGAFLQKATEGS